MNTQILSKEELKTMLGEVSFWKSKPVCTGLIYLSGIPGFDTYLKAPSIPKILAISFPLGLEIQLISGFNTVRTGILYKDVIEVKLQDSEQLKVLTKKSVIGRAVIGGLILGPVGALVGGMSGLDQKKLRLKCLI